MLSFERISEIHFLRHNEWNDYVTVVLPLVMSQGTPRRLNNINAALLGVSEHHAINSGNINAFSQATRIGYECALVNREFPQ